MKLNIKNKSKKTTKKINCPYVKICEPEYADDYIYAAEHGHLLPPVTFDEEWEQYKEDVGYYKRHPEREEESKAYIKNWLERYNKYCERKEKRTKN